MSQTKLKFKYHYLGLAAIILLSIILNFYKLGQEGYGNTYYAAATKSMMDSWHNFFFNSFDPKGFITIDKPPVGFWLQTISAYIFGFKGWSLFLPQALAGVSAVGLLYYLVSRVFGFGAGILAALFLAVTPIVVAADRTNEVDSMLMFVTLIATWAISKAVEQNHSKWLVLAFFLVGVGFNIKMMEAYLVLPAFYVFYAISSKLTWTKKVTHLFISTIILVVVSLSWSIIIDSNPTNNRPYIGSTQDNSMVSLAIGYNGINRLVGQKRSQPGNFHVEIQQGQMISNWNGVRRPFYKNTDSDIQSRIQQNNNNSQFLRNSLRNKGNNYPGYGQTEKPWISRLFTTPELDGQISWLLPGAFISILSFLWRIRFGIPLNRKQQTVILWTIWVLTMFVFFSIAKRFSSYYMVMMAPGIATLAGVGFMEMWKQWREKTKKTWFLPIALVCTVVFEISIVWKYPTLRDSLSFAIGALAFLSLFCMIFIQKHNTPGKKGISVVAIVIGVLSILAAPIVWAMTPIEYGGNVAYPFAGPELKTQASRDGLKYNSKLENYLKMNYQKGTYLVATLNATTAAPIILDTGLPVMAMGGFNGNDPVLTVEKLNKLVYEGQIRYFLLPNRASVNQQSAILNWIKMNCVVVPVYRWQGSQYMTSMVRGRMGIGNSSSMTLYEYLKNI